MELETQQFLRNGGTLVDLESRYVIKARVADELGIVMLNYTQALSPMNERICQECRALILELGTWRVVSRSFFKFFNHGQPEAHALDWSTARVEEKMDGSLICIYHWAGEWRIGTRGVADASGLVGENSISFRALVLRSVTEMGLTWPGLTDLMDPGVSYSFELTTPENRVIVQYRERSLTLLGAWRLSDLSEIDAREAAIVSHGLVRCPQRHSLNVADCGELARLAEQLDPFESEGYVVVDAGFRRVKVKNPLYVAASTVVAGLSTTKQYLELIRSDKYDDVASLLPPQVLSQIDLVRGRLAAMCNTIVDVYRSIAQIESQKDFAAEALKHPWYAILFHLRKGDDISAGMNRLTLDGLLRLYEAAYPADVPAPAWYNSITIQ